MPFLLLIYQMVNKHIFTKNLAKTAKIKNSKQRSDSDHTFVIRPMTRQ
ncbi:hypothetical protein YE105_C1966 [Yersinia enterocolitica subsp. palearctica 105.5R(r)]|uniref:Uncharacterized protein n=1 Tax=Yersinia enterocolitica subsp. palearctica serotype O:3 (strain DSM 13030 / CIP 106945 / Y11) TaxID=930944 RepID=A0A0H3NQT6_YERE1|nr:hypothetical protein YE105_C1966 [Yersinia enterocolitica subsp. palearctica 105.5R(r)]CBY27423.1 hypothetical protein Y11_07581 [Yersinia enterocolitica subsp. palearctica Y11]CCO68839.1 FIG01222908: hypothetical protein [Yersinia enterocolitica IP 10393]